MAVTFNLTPGMVVLCDFSYGFVEPEMVKANRPVIVLTPSSGGLVTVVACSTKEPEPKTAAHYAIPKIYMPKTSRFMNADSWVKGDMVYRVSHKRLDLIRLPGRRSDGKRRYHKDPLGKAHLDMIRSCVLHGLNVGHLTQHL